MSIDIVRGELERLFSLDEMMALSSDLLGFAPSDIGGAASKASFARALTDRCLELDAVEALLDAVLASRTEVDPRFRELAQKGLSLPELQRVVDQRVRDRAARQHDQRDGGGGAHLRSRRG